MGGIMNTVGKVTRKLGDPLGVFKKPEMQSAPADTTATPAAPAASGPTEANPEATAEKSSLAARRGKKSVTVRRAVGASVGLNV